MTLQIVLMLAGLVILTVGADLLVRGGAALALKFGLPPLVVGLTVVAFGTSAPELVVSLDATLSNKGSIALGNVVGSNICNLALILGLTSLIAPVGVAKTLFRFDLPVVVVATAVVTGMVLLDGQVGRIEALILMTGLAAYLFVTVKSGRAEVPEEIVAPSERKLSLSILLVLAGLGGLIFGGDLFVSSASDLARSFGVSEAVIGLTLVAVGTSLPELATSVVAAFKSQADIAVGNVIGSNIFNLLGILGISAAVNPIDAMGIRPADLFVMCGALLLTIPLMRTRYELQRWEGALLLAGYVAYVTMLVQS